MSELENTRQTLENLDRYIGSAIDNKLLNSSEHSKKWEIDKKIPLSLMFAIGLQLVALVGFAVKMDSRLANAEEKIVAQQAELTKRAEWAAIANDRMTRIEAMLENVNETLRGMKVILEKRK